MTLGLPGRNRDRDMPRRWRDFWHRGRRHPGFEEDGLSTKNDSLDLRIKRGTRPARNPNAVLTRSKPDSTRTTPRSTGLNKSEDSTLDANE